jgi:hypothetical protein
MSSPVHSAGPNDTLNLLLTPGRVTGLAAYNTGAATAWLMVFDQIDAPNEDDVPDFAPIPIGAGVYYESLFPRDCKIGCWVVASSVSTGYTAIGGEVWVDGIVS